MEIYERIGFIFYNFPGLIHLSPHYLMLMKH